MQPDYKCNTIASRNKNGVMKQAGILKFVVLGCFFLCFSAVVSASATPW